MQVRGWGQTNPRVSPAPTAHLPSHADEQTLSVTMKAPGKRRGQEEDMGLSCPVRVPESEPLGRGFKAFGAVWVSTKSHPYPSLSMVECTKVLAAPPVGRGNLRISQLRPEYRQHIWHKLVALPILTAAALPFFTPPMAPAPASCFSPLHLSAHRNTCPHCTTRSSPSVLGHRIYSSLCPDPL